MKAKSTDGISEGGTGKYPPSVMLELALLIIRRVYQVELVS